MKTMLNRFLLLVIPLITGFYYLNAQWEQCNGEYKPLIGLVNEITFENNTIYACTNNGIYISTDEGNSWDDENTGLSFLNVYTIHFNSNYRFAGTWGAGIYISSGDDIIWEKRNDGLTNQYIYTIQSYSNNTFVGTKGGVFLTTDYGKSWRGCGLIDKNIYSIVVKNNKVYAGTDADGIFVTSDLGEHWEPLNSGLDNLTINSLCIHNNNLIAGTGAGVYISTDNGDNWSEKNNTLSNVNIMTVACIGDSIIAGTYGSGVNVSTDFGESWTERSNGITDLFIEKFSIINNQIWVITKSGKLFISGDIGKNWYVLANKSIKIKDKVYQLTVNNNILYACGDKSNLYYSTNEGNTWFSEKIDVSESSIYSILIEENKFFAITNKGFHRSLDNGNNWEYIKEFKSSKSLISLANNIIVGTWYGDIYFSSDDGNSWIARDYGLPITFYCKMISVSDKIITCFGNGGGIFISSDMGLSWIKKDSGIIGSVHLLSEAGNNILAGSSWTGIYISKDFGNSWNESSYGITNKQIKSIAVWGDIYLIATEAGMFITYDEGDSWTFIDGTSNYKYINSIVINKDNIFIVNNDIIYRSKLKDLNITQKIDFNNTNNSELEINPNPSSHFIKINIFNYFGSIEIYSILGMKVVDVKYENQIDISSLTPGMYFLKAGDKVYKFIKI